MSSATNRQPSANLEAQTKARDLEDQTGVSLSVIGLANVAIASGDQGAARELLSSEEAGSALSTVATQAALLRAQAGLAATAGDGVQAVGLHVQVLGLRQHLADARAMTESLEDLALLCFAGRDAQLAASLLAPARSFRRSAGAPVPPLYREDLDRVIASLRGPGQPQGVHDAWQEGSSQPIASAVALAQSRFAPLAGEAGRSRSAPPGAW